MGWYKNINDSLPAINEQLDNYSTDPYSFELEEGDIQVYSSTFGSAFDVDVAALLMSHVTEDAIDGLYDIFQGSMIRGFVHYFNDEDYDAAVKLLVKE